jgi:rhamnosyltransferase
MSPNPNPDILVSVIIPVKNGAATIRLCLEALVRQTIAASMEIILIDSGSKDDTNRIAADFPVKILTIAPGTFNHGLTRNLGATEAKGEFLYFTVQDARLAADDALQHMLDHFKDKEVMGVCGTQAVPPGETDKNPVLWYHPFSAPGSDRYQFPDASVYRNLPAERRLELSRWDNVNAMYRRSALQALPFIPADFAEDMFWARSALEKGWAIVRDTGIIAWHYHHRDFSYAFREAFILHYAIYRYFDILPAYPPVARRLTVIGAILWRERSVGYGAKFYWLFHNLGDLLGSWLATKRFRSAARGRDENKIRQAYLRYCSQVPQGRVKGQ